MKAQKKILVVDDDRSILEMEKALLEASGRFIVMAVDNPMTVQDVARRFKPDLIVLDISMPGMDGGGVAEQLKHDAVLSQIPVIFLSSIITKEDEAKNGTAQAPQYIVSKPVTGPALIAHIDRRLLDS